MTSLPRALIFDCDGTLVLTGDMHFKAFTEAFAEQNAILDRSFLKARDGMSRKDLIAAWQEATGKTVDSDRLIRDSIASAAVLARTGRCQPNPPIAALAQAWRARPSAVASNGEASVVLATLEGCGLAALFDAVVTLSDVSAPKPDPEMFLLAADRLQCAPSDCLVLEDSTQGLEAARRAGIASLDVRQPEALTRIAEMTMALAFEGGNAAIPARTV